MLHVMTKDEAINSAGMLVYLVEGKETPHFLSIFHGRMMIFTDEHKDSIPTRFLLHVTGNRQYNTKAKQVRQKIEKISHAEYRIRQILTTRFFFSEFQVPLKASSLDSNRVLILHCSDKICYVWCGKGSTGDDREMAKNIANKITIEDFIVVYEGI